VLFRRGHTYVAYADVPALLRSRVRSELVSAGFVNVSVRAAEGPNYNTIGQGTWTGEDRDVDLPAQVVRVRDITPAAAEPAAPEPGPVVTPLGPAAPVGPAPGPPSPPPAARPRRRRRAPEIPDHSVTVATVIVGGVLVGWLYKLKKSGFWERAAWR
jgi:hypothetical protein